MCECVCVWTANKRLHVPHNAATNNKYPVGTAKNELKLFLNLFMHVTAGMDMPKQVLTCTPY